MSFADDTAVERVAPGLFTADLHERWLSLVAIHGGYSAAVVARAIEAMVDDPDRPLRTFAAQLAAPPQPGPVEVDVRIERRGRTMTMTSARLVQDGAVLQVVHAVSARVRPGLAYSDDAPPRPADPGGAPRFRSPGFVAHFDNVDVRLDPDVRAFAGTDDAWIGAWVRPLPGEVADAPWLVAMCDVLPPAIFTRTTGPVQAATLEYVVHLATGDPQLTAGEHLYLSCRSPLSQEGFLVEDATAWGPDGRVIAMARQTRLAGVERRHARPAPERVAAGRAGGSPARRAS